MAQEEALEGDRAVEERLTVLAEEGLRQATEEGRRRIEAEVLALLEPLARAVIRAKAAGRRPDPLREGVEMGHFHLAALSMWRERLFPSTSGCGEIFDPARGTFVGFLLGRFSLRLRDHANTEEHCVRRCLKTEARRLSAAGTEETGSWGYVRIDSLPENIEWPDNRWRRDQDRLEARLELDVLLNRMESHEKNFLAPLLDQSVENLLGLARYWGLSPAAVTKRLHKIRSKVGAWEEPLCV